MKRKGIWKRGVVVSGIMLAMNLSGCSFFVKKDSGNTDIQSVRQESENADKTVMKRSKSEEKEAEEARHHQPDHRPYFYFLPYCSSFFVLFEISLYATKDALSSSPELRKANS